MLCVTNGSSATSNFWNSNQHLFVRTLTSVILFLICCDAYSQQDTATKKAGAFQEFKSRYLFSNDTIVKKGLKFRVTNIAFQINVGATKYFHDNKTEKYFGNYWSPSSVGIYVYYKNFFYGSSGSITTINVNDTLYFSDKILFKDEPLDISKTNIEVGYCINVPRNFSVEPRLGILATSFYSKDKDISSQSLGFSFGLSLNKYITLRPRRYLLVFINTNFNQSNFSSINSSLGNYFYSINFGVGYKAWFLKRIKE